MAKDVALCTEFDRGGMIHIRVYSSKKAISCYLLRLQASVALVPIPNLYNPTTE